MINISASTVTHRHVGNFSDFLHRDAELQSTNHLCGRRYQRPLLLTSHYAIAFDGNRELSSCSVYLTSVHSVLRVSLTFAKQARPKSRLTVFRLDASSIPGKTYISCQKL